METFTKPREFVKNRGYVGDRQRSIAALPHRFTLQCCYGHFVCAPEQAPHNIDPIPLGFSGLATYRIAYIALSTYPIGSAISR